MNLFDLVFLLSALAAAAAVLTSAGVALGGQGQLAMRILGRLGIGAAVYFGVVILVSASSPAAVTALGSTCWNDDWGITVVRAARATTGELAVELRLSSRAQRVTMGENGTYIYALASDGRRYQAEPDSSALPFSTKLAPGESVITTRRFRLPAGTELRGLVYTDRFPIGWLVIGEGGWLSEPPLLLLRR